MDTISDLQAKALEDFRKALGTVIEVRTISGYNDSDDCVAIDGVPVKVRVCDTPESDLFHWVDEFLDPYWNVEPVEQIPEIAGLRSFWTYGPSYQLSK